MKTASYKSALKKITLPAVFALLTLLRLPAAAVDLSQPHPVGYLKTMWGDIEELPKKPGTWSKNQWLTAGGVVAATGGALFIDGDVRTYYETHRHENWHHLSNIFTHFGDYRYQVPLISAFYVGGRVFNSPVMYKVAADSAEASIIAAFMINPVLCYLSGRALPSAHEKADTFKPFTFHRYSFPSGHTSAAFALASVLDTDLRGTFGYWQTPVVYGMAVAVAHSRVYDDKHYLSEVILGGAIGWSIGTWIASKDRGQAGPPAVMLLPYKNGAQLAWLF